MSLQYTLALLLITNLAGLFKSLRCHISLRVHLRLLKELGDTTGGFIPLFLILATQPALLLCLTTSTSGLSSSLSSILSSLSVVLQVALGYVDYDSFTSHSFGLGSGTTVVVLLFYGAVVVLTVVVQSTVLATTGSAHDASRRPESTASSTTRLLLTLVLLYTIAVLPLVYFSLLDMYFSLLDLVYHRNSQREGSASRATSLTQPLVQKLSRVDSPLWRKLAALVRHGRLLKCLSFVHMDSQTDELRTTRNFFRKQSNFFCRKVTTLDFTKLASVEPASVKRFERIRLKCSVSLELTGRAPWVGRATREVTTSLSGGSAGTGTTKRTSTEKGEIELSFEAQSNKTVDKTLSVLSDSETPSISSAEAGVPPAPTAALSTFSETLSTELELELLLRVAADVFSDSLPRYPISKQPLPERPSGGGTRQAAALLLDLFLDSDVNSYKVFESDMEKSRQGTSVFEVVDDAVDSKRRFEQVCTGGSRSSVLLQKVDDRTATLEKKIEHLLELSAIPKK